MIEFIQSVYCHYPTLAVYNPKVRRYAKSKRILVAMLPVHNKARIHPTKRDLQMLRKMIIMEHENIAKFEGIFHTRHRILTFILDITLVPVL